MGYNLPRNIFSRLLDTDGDGTGTTNMAVNGAVTPVVFKLAPEAGTVMLVARVIFYVEDSGTFDADKWGNGITITTGIEMKAKRTNDTESLCEPLTKTGELAGLMHDVNHFAFGTGNEIISSRLTFSKFGNPIRLVGNYGDELQIIINDDLTGLVNQRVTAQGQYASQ